MDLSDVGSGPGSRASLERALRTAIVSGRLRPGSPLPSTRQLARELGVARGTVVAAIEQLAVEGLLQTRQGAVTRVAHVPTTLPARRRPPPASRSRPLANFAGGDPDLTLFPRSWWATAVRRAVASMDASAVGYGDIRGRLELRAALAEYLARTRAVVVDPHRIVITAGFSQALAAIGRAVRDGMGGAIAVEDPSLSRHRDLLASAGFRLVPVDVDEHGVRVDDMARCGVSAALVTPAHHLPLGVSLSPARRSALVSWAAANEAVVVEDDYDGELRYDRQPVGALQSLDPQRVVYCGTASKAMAPGLRIGWCVVPPHWLDAVSAELVAIGGPSVSTIDQLALADVVSSGRYDRHVRKIRAEYRRRRDLLLSAIAEAVPGVRMEGVAAGLVGLLRLPEGTDELAVVDALADRSVAVDGFASFTMRPTRGSHGAALVVNYGQPFGHEYRGALRHLSDALAAVLPRRHCG